MDGFILRILENDSCRLISHVNQDNQGTFLRALLFDLRCCGGAVGLPLPEGRRTCFGHGPCAKMWSSTHVWKAEALYPNWIKLAGAATRNHMRPQAITRKSQEITGGHTRISGLVDARKFTYDTWQQDVLVRSTRKFCGYLVPETILHHEVVESWEPMWYTWTAVPSLGTIGTQGNPGEAKDGVFPPSSGQQDVFDKAGIGWGSDVRGYLGTWLPSLGMKVWQHVKLHENYLGFDLTPTKLNNCNPSVLFPLDCLDFSDQRQ